MHLQSRSFGEGVWAVGLAVLLLLQAHIAMAGLVGGKSDVPNAENSLEMDELAKYAVSEHNNRENAVTKLSFSKLLRAQQQVVAGTMYHLTVEVLKSGEAEVWEAKVWIKPWEKFKALQEFKFLRKASADGEKIEKDDCPADANWEGLRQVPNDDPVVQEAAEHALKGLQQRSNSLVPYQLQDVVSAHAGVCDDSTNLELVLKVKRSHEEHFKAELHRTGDGVWSVKHFTPL